MGCLCFQSHLRYIQNLAICREFEARIDGYEGDDPLELWFEYIYWIEQTYPRNGRESAFEEALQRCIKTFEHEGKYKQDRRMVKLYIKFVSSWRIASKMMELIVALYLSRSTCSLNSTTTTIFCTTRESGQW